MEIIFTGGSDDDFLSEYTIIIIEIMTIIVIIEIVARCANSFNFQEKSLIAKITTSGESSDPPVKIISMHNKSGELVNYSVPYIMSFLVADLSNIKFLISFGFF
jgi:hypothetical protein